MVDRVGPGSRPSYASFTPDKKKIDNKIIAACLQPVHEAAKIGNSVKQEHLIDLMINYLKKEMAKSGVKTDFLNKAVFPNLTVLTSLVELIQGIQNKQTCERLFKDLYGILVGMYGKENLPKSFMERLANLAGGKDSQGM